MTETTALGAAMAAGNAEGVGVWNLDCLDQSTITSDTFNPTVTEGGTFFNICRTFHRPLLLQRVFVFQIGMPATPAGRTL